MILTNLIEAKSRISKKITFSLNHLKSFDNIPSITPFIIIFNSIFEPNECALRFENIPENR